MSLLTKNHLVLDSLASPFSFIKSGMHGVAAAAVDMIRERNERTTGIIWLRGKF